LHGRLPYPIEGFPIIPIRVLSNGIAAAAMQPASVNEFRIIRKLGEGAYADVYMVKSLRDQNTYAEKRLKKRYRSFEEVSQLVEIIALRLVARHANIVTLHSLMYDGQSGHVALIFEPVEMNLLEFLTQQTAPLDEQSVLLLVYQLAKAISYVHSVGLFHRDIKPENCLVNSETLELKLADFGSAGQDALHGIRRDAMVQSARVHPDVGDVRPACRRVGARLRPL
jgi:serine/threonine protein kinase